MNQQKLMIDMNLEIRELVEDLINSDMGAIEAVGMKIQLKPDPLDKFPEGFFFEHTITRLDLVNLKLI